MAKTKAWLRWFLFRFHWRLTLASLAYFAAPWATPQHSAILRDACMAVMIASLYSWAHKIGARNGGQHDNRSDLFGVREGKRVESAPPATPSGYEK